MNTPLLWKHQVIVPIRLTWKPAKWGETGNQFELCHISTNQKPIYKWSHDLWPIRIQFSNGYIIMNQPKSSLQKGMWHWTNQISIKTRSTYWFSLETHLYRLIWLVYLYPSLWLHSYLHNRVLIQVQIHILISITTK